MSDARDTTMVAMRDGVRLATDVYFPPNLTAAAPVLLERIPYSRRGTNGGDFTMADPVPQSKPDIARAFADAGYVYVLQDCRGRYDSEGEFVKYRNEGNDGVDTLAWIRAQPWCDGQVGTLGLSYGAHVQVAMASRGPKGLAAMFLDSGGFSSAFESGIRQGGAFELKQLTWALKHARLSPLTAADPVRKAALDAIAPGAIAGLEPWQPGMSPLAAAPEYERYVIDQWRHELFDDYWRTPELYARGWHHAFPDVPMVHMSGWYDPYAQTAVDHFVGLRAAGRCQQWLLIGPWTHGRRSEPFAGDVDFGTAAPLDGNIAPDYFELRRSFFDRHLRGSKEKAHLSSPVSLFLMGGGSGRRTAAGRLDHGGRWLRSDAWPPPGVVTRTVHVHTDRSLRDAPAADDTSLLWIADPERPVPTIGGAIASGAPLMEPGAFDQRTNDRETLGNRDDLLSLRSEALDHAVDLVGAVEADLWVSSSAIDTDVVVKLIDEYPPSMDYPNGYAMNLAKGIRRLRFRNGYDRAETLVPGQAVRVRITLFPTANRFMPGHRIRIDIASSDFPHFDINANNGAPAGEVADPVVATNRLHLSLDHRSFFVLPIMRVGDNDR